MEECLQYSKCLSIRSGYEKFDHGAPSGAIVVVGLKGVEKVFTWGEMFN